VSDIFDYYPEGHYLNWKPFFELEQPLRTGARALTKALFFNATHLHHFFEKCLYHTQLSWLKPEDRNIIRSQQLQSRSFISQLMLSAKSNSSKTFRQAFTQAHQYQPFLWFPILKKNWITYWKMSLTFLQRNVIYRIIHNKVPCKYNLNRVFNNQNGISEESKCPICQEAQETVDHFFFLCSKKNPFGRI
jgi:hypothetical protein